MKRRTVIRRLLSFIRPLRKIMAASVTARILNQTAGILLIAAAIWGIGQTAVHGRTHIFWPFLAVLAGIGMLKGLFRYLEQFTGHYVAFRLLSLLRNTFYERIEPLIPAGLPEMQSGDVVSRVTSDVDRVEPFYAHTIAPVITAAVIPGAAGAVLFLIHPLFGWILLPFVFLLGAGIPLIVLHSKNNVSVDVRKATGQVNAFLTDSFQGLRTVLAFGYGDRRRQELRSQGKALATLEQKQKASQAVQSGLNGALTAGAAVALLAAGVRLVTDGVIGVTTVPLIVAVGYLSLDPLTKMTEALTDFNTALASAGRLFELMDRPRVIGEPDDPVEVKEFTPSLRFESVSFRYPSVNGNGATGPVLTNLNFEIRPGETVGLAGPSGAGKSTIVHLLLRFRDPDAGRILLGGTDFTSLRLEDIRANIGVVSQQTYLFNTTIRENILLGKPDAGEKELESAVRKANLEALVRTLPDGLDTEVGEMGSRLSGGEKQRIAIARAFLKDAPILILDEATSNLDADNEQAIRYILDTLMQDRTTLIIAHRLSTIMDADRILVLDNGRIAEQGRHDDLIANDGVYTRLFVRQQDELDDRAVS